MIMGLTTATFTTVHVLISLVAIAAGFIAFGAMLRNRWSHAWNSVFLVMTIATSVTGFMFHSKFGPPDVIGIISLLVLAVSVFSLYRQHLAGMWQPVYTVSAAVALYLNVFVGVVQSFQKIPLLQSLAPTQSEGPFIAAQSVVFVAFVALAYFAVRRLRPVTRLLAPAM